MLQLFSSQYPCGTHDKHNVEVVVNVHAGRTTTSEQSQLGVLTCSKRKLITSETETAAQASKKLLWQTYQSQQQLQTATRRCDDDDTIARVNITTHTNRLRLRVQVQLFQPARNDNTGRRRLKDLAPSSFEISFAAKPRF